VEASCAEDVYPVEWAGRQAVVALLEHIDVSNAGQIREQLLSVINRSTQGWGIPWALAPAVADQVDWHQVANLVQQGCPPRLAFHIGR